MAVKAATTPRNLGENGRKLWRNLARQVANDGLIMDERELFLLHSACGEADQLARIEAALEGEPMTVRGAQGQLVSHPLIAEARRSRTTIASLLKAIGLEDPTVSAKGSGSRTTPTQARAAAMTRHGGA